MNETPLAPIVAISPHLDDAVFGCGDRLAASPGSTVITVFAGGPAPSPARGLPPWDLASGFRPGDDVAAARRQEDQRALKALEGRPVWLDFWDSQYGREESPDAIGAELEAHLLDLRPRSVYFPVGLFHGDHRLVHQACLPLCERLSFEWFLYEDAIYRRYRDFPPGTRINELRREGFCWQPQEARVAEASAEKRRAVACYASQLQALSSTPGHPGYGDVFSPERYYRLRPSAREAARHGR